MRFNKAELATLASNPTTKFEKEGLLIITERQESFFRRIDVNYPRWCKLRGNLLFYLKDHDPLSPPVGVLVLENCRPLIKNEEQEFDGFVFILEFEGSYPQRISTQTAKERVDWVKSIQLASYAYLNRQIKYLQDQIDIKMGNRIERGTPVCTEVSDTTNFLLLSDNSIAGEMNSNTSSSTKQEEDLSEVPICESALSCDNLPVDWHGRLPNPRVVCTVLTPSDPLIWRDYARTEIIESSKNPQFLCTICFRQSDGFTEDTLLRFTVYDVREKLSNVALPIGYAEVALGVIQDATRFRIPLTSINGECGSIIIATWAPSTNKQIPSRSSTQVFEKTVKGHRRSQSLPPKLGVKLFVPYQGSLQLIFANPFSHTYRLHSGMGGDISVHEVMLECKLCFNIPQQLLSIWISREKELLQEISGMGELGGEWRGRQMDLLDKHLKLLKDYSQAKQNLQQHMKTEGVFFKRSSLKTDESLEFIPVNLHLQRMWAQNDTLKRNGVLDIITVGAFTKHSTKTRRGGLIKLLQETKESPSKFENSSTCKVQAANDVVQAIKQLRKEIVEIMSQLLCLAKKKNSKGMMPLCNEMVTKTKTLLNIWEPNLVEEAFAFIEQHRIIEEPDNTMMPVSPFRKITQQLSALELKSPELEDFSTPIVAPPDLWPNSKTPTGTGRTLMRANSLHLNPSASIVDLNAIRNLHSTVKFYNEHLKKKKEETTAAPTHFDNKEVQVKEEDENEAEEVRFQSLPTFLNTERNFIENKINNRNLDEMDNINIKLIDLDEVSITATSTNSNLNSNANSILKLNQNAQSNNLYAHHFDEDNDPFNCNINFAHNPGFLDTKMMSSCPSANYYRPTEEPEPLDLTQLNIEASVMCLVSKIKFLCGRCGSPAIRLRHPKSAMKRSGFSNSPAPDVIVNQTILPLNNGNENEIQQQQIEKYQQEQEISTTTNTNGNALNLDLTQQTEKCQKKVNKFTEGLDLSLTTDWASELRPSMRKLRHAMDGLLKTARLMHSVQRLQQDMKRNSINLEIMYRRDVCFSQALTALISALMSRFWATEITENFIKVIFDLGPIAYFEGLLSMYGSETDMWGDMCIAIEDLLAVNFAFVRSNLQSNDIDTVPIPRVIGSRQSLTVLLPIPEAIFTKIPNDKTMQTFKVTPVFFNIGINEKATLAETLGLTREQHRSNWDNFLRLKQYYSRYRKLSLITPNTPYAPAPQTILNILNFMEDQLRANVSKNVKILHLAEDACRLMSGFRFTSCKSAKDRTGMAVTLEQCRVLVQEFSLPAKNVPHVLSTMRSEGTRIDNVYKNINKRKYAFNLPQVMALPAMYRPQIGTYGKAET